MSAAVPPLRVVVVEDSITQQSAIARLLAADGDIEVVARAASADEAYTAVVNTDPDAVTVDLLIPGGGLNLIERLLAHRALPVLVLSSMVGGAGSREAVQALAAGAIDAVPKPMRWDEAAGRQLRARVRAVRGVKVRPAAARAAAARPAAATTGQRPVVGIVASTGGPQAIAAVLTGLADLVAPICIVQHIHVDFADGFAEWLGASTKVPVTIARNGTVLQPGTAYVAPGGSHLRVTGLRALLDPEPSEAIHRPSGDVLLGSIAASCGPSAVGLVLTGMGDDGAAGLLAVRRAGGRTIAQDEPTSTVWGMPRAAATAGAAIEVLGLPAIAPAVRRAVDAARRAADRTP